MTSFWTHILFSPSKLVYFLFIYFETAYVYFSGFYFIYKTERRAFFGKNVIKQCKQRHGTPMFVNKREQTSNKTQYNVMHARLPDQTSMSTLTAGYRQPRGHFANEIKCLDPLPRDLHRKHQTKGQPVLFGAAEHLGNFILLFFKHGGTSFPSYHHCFFSNDHLTKTKK